MRFRATRLSFLLPALLVTSTLACVPSARLDGTSWRVVAIAGEAPVPGREPTVTFAGNGVQGSGGCNSLAGRYLLDGDRITFTDITMTAMGCPGPEMEVEGHFSQLLGQVQRVVVTGDRMTLVSPVGNLDFIRVAPEGPGAAEG